MDIYLLRKRERHYTPIADMEVDEVMGLFTTVDKAVERLQIEYSGDVTEFGVDYPIVIVSPHCHETPFRGYYLEKYKLNQIRVD